MRDKFKLIRIKNKLDDPANNIIINYLFMVAEDMREHMASLGFRTVNEMIGRVDVLESANAVDHWKAKGIDLTALLTPANKPHDAVEVYHTQAQDHGLDKALDHTQLFARFMLFSFAFFSKYSSN